MIRYILVRKSYDSTESLVLFLPLRLHLQKFDLVHQISLFWVSILIMLSKSQHFSTAGMLGKISFFICYLVEAKMELF